MHIAANSRLTPFNFQATSTDFCSVKAISVKAKIWCGASQGRRELAVSCSFVLGG